MDGGKFSAIGDFLAEWNLVSGDEEDGVGADDVVTKTLCKAVKFVGIGTPSNVFIGYLDKVAVFKALAGGDINDEIGPVLMRMEALTRNEVGSRS